MVKVFQAQEVFQIKTWFKKFLGLTYSDNFLTQTPALEFELSKIYIKFKIAVSFEDELLLTSDALFGAVAKGSNFEPFFQQLGVPVLSIKAKDHVLGNDEPIYAKKYIRCVSCLLNFFI